MIEANETKKKFLFIRNKKYNEVPKKVLEFQILR